MAKRTIERVVAVVRRMDPRWVFLVAFLGCCGIYEYGRVMRLPPLPMHLWRQADCLSLAANYHTGEARFLAPVIHARIADDGESGFSAGELPVLYWVVGRSWRITGQSELVYRTIGLALLFMGLLALHDILSQLGFGPFWSVGLAVLTFTSPVLVYYGISFLPDVPAFAFALVGVNGVVRFARERRMRWWVMGMLAFALAVGLKVSAGMGLIALLGVYSLVTVVPQWRGRWGHLFPDPLAGWTAALLTLAPIVAWYVHAEQFNQWHEGRYTFNALWPIWEMSDDEVDAAIDFARDLLWYQVFDTSVWALVAIAVGILLWNVRKTPAPLGLFNGSLVVGLVLYTLFWFHAVDGHDYYFINPIIVPLALLASGVWWLRAKRPRTMSSFLVRVSFAALVIYNVVYARTNLTLRSEPERTFMPRDLVPVYHAGELDWWNAQHWGPLTSLIGLAEHMDNAGIARDALVVVPEDGTINASLYFLGRHGFTNYGLRLRDAHDMERRISLGARYLILVDEHWEEDADLRHYVAHPVFEHNGARVYDLGPLTRPSEQEVVLAGPWVRWTSVLHMDTLACVVPGPGACHTGVYQAWALDDLQLGGAAVLLAEVDVEGTIQWDHHARNPGNLLLWQRDENGREHWIKRPLRSGPFQYVLRADPRMAIGGNRLLVENLSGKGYRLSMDTVRVRRVMRDAMNYPIGMR